MIDRIKLQKGQVPTETDWETWLNLIVDMLNAGLSPQYLAKNLANRVVIDIEGDAKTVGGKTADQIAGGDFPEVKKTLIDLIGGGLVLKGGVATKNGTTANQLDITATTVLMKETSTGYISRVELIATSKSTTLANTTYYLDVADNATDYSFGTSHPVGDYIPLATVSTDASGNITTVTDVRPLTTTLFSGMDGKVLLQGHVTTEELASKMHETTGHKHTGVAGDGPKIDADKLRGYIPDTGTTANTIPVRGADGSIPGAGAWEIITAVDLSGATSVNITGLNNYKFVRILFTLRNDSSEVNLNFRLNGHTAGYNFIGSTFGTGYAGVVSDAFTSFGLLQALNSTSGRSAVGEVEIYSPSSGDFVYYRGVWGRYPLGGVSSGFLNATNAAPLTSCMLIPGAGGLHGHITVLGVRR